jgi:hypothetical protein
MSAILVSPPSSGWNARGEQEPWSASVQALDRIVRRCLEKRPEDRLQSARDLGLALAEVAASADARATPVGSPATSPALDHVIAPARGWRRPRFIVLAASLLLVIASLATLVVVILAPSTDARAVRYVVFPPPKTEPSANWTRTTCRDE